MRVIICGGRDYTDEAEAFDLFDRTHQEYGPITEVLEGGQRGADRLGRQWAQLHNISFRTFTADWSSAPYMQYAGGPIRNQKMIDESPALVIALPGGDGTADLCQRATNRGIPIVTLNTIFW